MTRVQERQLARKRRLAVLYVCSSVLTVGLIGVMIPVALSQPTGHLAWYGCWGFAVHQAVMLVVHARSAVRTHVEAEDLLREYTSQQEGWPIR